MKKKKSDIEAFVEEYIRKSARMKKIIERQKRIEAAIDEAEKLVEARLKNAHIDPSRN